MDIPPKELRENSRAYALRVLMQNIVNLELLPGATISENELSNLLGLSRTPIREALIELSRNGLVEIMPQKGSYVSKIDCDMVEEARFVRLILENAVLRLACEKIPPLYLIKLRSNLAEQELCNQEDDFAGLMRLDDEFHKLIFDSVGKQWTYNVLRNQMLHFDRLRLITLKTISSEQTIKDHDGIIRAIEAHDGDKAVELMTEHLNRNRINKDEAVALYPEYFV